MSIVENQNQQNILKILLCKSKAAVSKNALSMHYTRLQSVMLNSSGVLGFYSSRSVVFTNRL